MMIMIIIIIIIMMMMMITFNHLQTNRSTTGWTVAGRRGVDRGRGLLRPQLLLTLH